MKKLFYLLAAVLTVLGVYAFSANENDPGHLYEKNGRAISGYDAVSYFKEHNAVQGKSAYQLQWKGVTWQFSTAENKALFEAMPEKYEPQYGGYCAYGASKGYKAPTDPEAWTIVDGKLYLNYSAKVKSLWLPDTTERIKSADLYWQSLIQKN